MSIERKLEESYMHILPYISRKETPLLLQMCSRCQKYSGKSHDFSKCKNEPCFQLFLGYEYARWSDSFENN